LEKINTITNILKDLEDRTLEPPRDDDDKITDLISWWNKEGFELTRDLVDVDEYGNVTTEYDDPKDPKSATEDCNTIKRTPQCPYKHVADRPNIRCVGSVMVV
jgi:hypothetical protein